MNKFVSILEIWGAPNQLDEPDTNVTVVTLDGEFSGIIKNLTINDQTTLLFLEYKKVLSILDVDRIIALKLDLKDNIKDRVGYILSK